ncbi:MAG TPA: DUF4188 domain-containing protein [Sphingobium sp.]|nr:DUF4188 domain-containing protein [Sphingobium sp.]
MQQAPLRETVDLSDYPDLVVIDLGFRISRFAAIPALLRIGKGLREIARTPPPGVLGSRRMLIAWNHLGIRQYWADQDSLLAFTRRQPHAGWWRDFLSDTQGGSGFWHEACFAAGGMESVYINMPERTGFASFAPVVAPVGPLMTARDRLAADRDARTVSSAHAAE